MPLYKIQNFGSECYIIANSLYSAVARFNENSILEHEELCNKNPDNLCKETIQCFRDEGPRLATDATLLAEDNKVLVGEWDR